MRQICRRHSTVRSERSPSRSRYWRSPWSRCGYEAAFTSPVDSPVLVQQAHGSHPGRPAMQSWDLKTVEAEPYQPQILASAEDARTIVLHLPAGEELQEHEVHERARIVVVDGEVEATAAGACSPSPAASSSSSAPPAGATPTYPWSTAHLLVLCRPLSA